MTPSTIKLLIGSAITLAIIAAAYWAVQSYRTTIAENVQLRTNVAAQTATIKQMKEDQALINTAVDENAKETTRIIERTREIREAINATPETQNCASSPAIVAVIDRLRSEQTRPTTQPTNPVPQEPVPVQ